MNMSRLLVKRPVTPNTFPATENKFDHWSTAVYECCVTAFTDGTLNFSLEGGSDNGEFPFFCSISLACNSRSISKDDIILEAQGQKIAGYTQRDVLAWFSHCSRNGNLVRIRAVKAGYLTKDLRQYLNTRFQRGSVDHDLQNTIRDNLYLRTVPCTTRTPRDGEINGVDYTFLTADEFVALERSGNLLESGIYEGNHYGTPKPPRESTVFPAKRSNSLTVSGNLVLPGAHASSEGKRRRNRSNVEAMAAKADDPPDCSEYSLAGLSINTRSSTPVSALSSNTGCKNINPVPISDNSCFKPFSTDLPSNWERACTESGDIYFIDHNTGTSQWLDPRLSEVQRRKLESSRDDELPFGWERIDDPHYGTYFIDHVNRRTQYENPVLHERRLDENMFIGEFNADSTPWYHKAENKNNCEPSVNQQTVFADPQKSPQCTRNNSISQTTNSSNSQGAVGTSNSELFLISNNHSSSLPNSPSLPPPGNNLSSSPASTHRFPYLHCIPCLNEKHEPPKHNPDSKIEGIISNGNIASNTATSNRDGEMNQLQVSRSQSFSPGNGLYGNARTTLGTPVLSEDTRRNSEAHLPSSLSGQNSDLNPELFFTRNPEELHGDFIRTPLVKSSRGFGFTIIGGDNVTSEVLLQVKDVVPNGPAWCNGKLKTGDVLVYVNGECVLGHTHQDIVALFQSIPPGDVIHLEVCRGYPLPFDPNDPNTEIVTTVAVSKANTRTSEPQNVYSSSRTKAEPSSKFVSSDVIDSADSISRGAKSMPDLSSQLAEFQYPLRHNSAGLLNPVPFPSSDVTSRIPEFLTAEIVKGSAGFGFTIADSSYGQKVKKILDRPRCKQLQEGDILNEINGMEVRRLPHAEVVQILKDCPCDSTANIAIQRGGILPPSRNKAKSKTKINDELNEFDRSKRNGFTLHSSSLSSSSRKSDKGPSMVMGSYRSKTPTADLYSSRDKEHVMIKRPKTPLVDTRNWSNIPSSDAFVSALNSKHIQEIDQILVTPPEAESSFHHIPEDSNIKMSLYSSSPERRGNHSWYSDQSRGRNWNNHNFRDSVSIHEYVGPGKRGSSFCQDISEEVNDIFSSPQDHLKNSPMIVQKGGLSFENNVGVDADWQNIQTSMCDTSIPIQCSPGSGNSRSMEYGQPMYIPQDSSAFINNSNRQSLRSGTTYNPYPSLYHMSAGHNSGSHVSQTIPLQEGVLCNENSSSIPNYSSTPVSSLNISPGTHFEIWNQRKHSTSFEHEHPVPSPTAYIRDSRSLFSDHTYQSSGMRSNQSTDIVDYVDMSVTLHRQESGFGFRIVGGTEEGSQVSIGHIVPCGAADVDGRLHSGDEIVGVDGNLVYNTSHRHVVQLMGNAANIGKVTLHLRRAVSSGEQKGTTKPVDCSFPYDVTVTRNEDEGFGFVIISSVSRAGSTIGRIIESSPAERCGQLHIGDTILAVNGISILNMHHGDIVNLIKDSGYSVCLTIGHPFDDLSSSASISQKGDMSIEQDDNCHSVELSRGTKGFGFSIRGGKEFHNMPLFVLRIAERGPAHQDGRLQVGDQIIEINGVNTKNMTHADAIELIRQGGSTVRLLVKHGNKLPSYEQPSFSSITPVSLSPLASSILSGPLSQSSPRTAIAVEYTPDIYSWNYEQN